MRSKEKKKNLVLYINVAAAAVLSNLKRIEVTYLTYHGCRPLATPQHSTLLVPTIAELLLKNQVIPVIPIHVINFLHEGKQKYKFYRVKTLSFVVG